MASPIIISKPCTENWNAMTPQSEGRHCGSCVKVVKDFTHMSDAELIAYLQERKDKSGECGRFREDQVNSVLGSRHSWFYNFKMKSVAFFGLMFARLFMPGHAAAQNTNPTLNEGVNKIPVAPKSIFNDSVVYRISGLVSDAEEGPLAFTAVKVEINGKPAGISVYTDSYGYFELNVTAKKSTDKITLVFSDEHHQTLKMKNYVPDAKTLEVILKRKTGKNHAYHEKYIMGDYAF
jgi:hypothetical protein